MAKLANKFFPLVVFFGILLVPIAFFNREGFDPAHLQENRRLEPFPKFKLFWFQGLERWFNDRFGMRTGLVYYGARLQMQLLGISTNRKVILGHDGWLFLDENFKVGNPILADFLGRSPFSSPQLARIAANLKQTQSALASCSIPFYFVMAPDKQSIYPEKVPVQRSRPSSSRADQLFEYLRANVPELRTIDLRRPLLEEKLRQPRDLFLRTDTHWNKLGAFVAYREIASRLASDGVIPRTLRTDPTSYLIESIPFEGGDLAVSALFLPGYFEDYRVLFKNKLARNSRLLDGPPKWVDKSNPQELETYANPAGRTTLLVYRDSFFSDLLPFIAEDFGHVFAVFKPATSSEVDGRQVQQSGANVVLLEIVERHLHWLEKEMVNLQTSCP